MITYPLPGGPLLHEHHPGGKVDPDPYWFGRDEYYTKLQVPYLGQPRADHEYPMESFFADGVLVASASDFPVSSRRIRSGASAPASRAGSPMASCTTTRPGRTRPGCCGARRLPPSIR